MTAAVVLTADFNCYDDLPRVPQRQDVDVEWLYYTDRIGDDAPEPWRTIRVHPTHSTPNLCAKLYKTQPPVLEHDVVWIDANMEVTSPSLVRCALASRSTDGVAAWEHPRRDCVYEEADASVGAEAQGGKYDPFALASQVESYLAEGYPRHNGLYACGTIAWDLGNTAARELGGAWFDECVRWSPQDQLSFPVVAWRQHVTVGVFPIPQISPHLSRRREYLANEWLRIWPHRQHARSRAGGQ